MTGLPQPLWSEHRHWCLLYPTRESKEEALSSFVGSGRAANARIIHCLDPEHRHRSDTHDVGPADDDVETRSMFGNGSDTSAGIADLRRHFTAEVERARGKGYESLWVAAEGTEAAARSNGVAVLIDRERAMSSILDDLGVVVLCMYDRRRVEERVETALAEVHQGVADLGRPWLRIVPGSRSGSFRLVGELDLASWDAAEDSLAVAGDEAGIELDISGLTFIDAGGASVLCGPARQGRPTTLKAASPWVRRVLELTGLAELPDLTVVDA